MAGFALDSSDTNSSALSSWTIPSKTLPAGKLYFLTGFYRSTGSGDRWLSSVTHPAITAAAAVTDPASNKARVFYDDGANFVVGIDLWEVDSNGGVGDLVLTWTATVWAPGLIIYTGADVGPCLAFGTGTNAGSNNSSSVSVSASDARAKFGLASAYMNLSNNSAVLSASPWSTGFIGLTPANYRRFGAVADNSTTGDTVTFSLSAGSDKTSAALEVLFAQAGAGAVAEMMGF